ncbi:MAG: DUF3592 domain-containing protein [SAR324 cluster bacterium]|uniref:DUF3592 domain-containing protein n=1 Tax=SAR324 cluster bacterium TaxID=2024889 RepID=A0A7X9FQ06_9DELT|nr:DUF3592 domain-containing protein [SAR324 cluster bacterium]
MLKIISSVLFLIGTSLAYFFVKYLGIPMYESLFFTPQQCKVISSKVSYDPGDGESGPTYGIDILYSYMVEGKEYQSNKYYIVDSASSGELSKRKIVDNYPPGNEFTCFVNPKDPSQAVVVPGFNLLALLGLLPLSLLFLGIWLFALSNKTPKDASEFEGAAKKVKLVTQSSKVFAPETARKQKAWILFFVALFWNGIVSIFLVFFIKNRLSGSESLALLLFLSIFILVGFILIYSFVHSLLALKNPLIILTLAKYPIVLGDLMRLRVQVQGDATKLEKLSIEIEGKEEAKYRRGTSTYTDTNIFYRKLLKETKNQVEMRMSELTLEIPFDLMHSFSSASNKIIWTLKVRGVIPRWPDISDDYVLDVQPSSGS